MRALRRQEPNFLCTVERGGEKELRLEYGADAAGVSARLEARLFKVLSVEPYDFSAWRTLAKQNTEAACAALQKGKPYTFNAEVWRRVKQFIFALANDMCGYCEGEVLLVTAGEVEHYRPKARVDGEKKHRGYYWLAYEFSNYVPSCSNCNGARGKANQFPISGARALTSADDLAQEKPLLLHPFEHDPGKHLRFVVGGPQLTVGTVEGVTPEGKTSVDVYRLNRGPLQVERQRVINDLRANLARIFVDREARARLISELKDGTRPFASTALATYRAWLTEMEAELRKEREAALAAPSPSPAAAVTPAVPPP